MSTEADKKAGKPDDRDEEDARARDLDEAREEGEEDELDDEEEEEEEDELDDEEEEEEEEGEGEDEDELEEEEEEDEEEDELDDEEEEEEEEEEDEDEPPAPPAKAKTSAKTPPAAAARTPAKPMRPAGKGPGKKHGKKVGRRAVPVAKKGSPTRNIVFFVLLVVGLALAFAVLGNAGGGGMGRDPDPGWKVGQEVPVEITLVHTDARSLGCAMASEVNGRHCAFTAQNKRGDKPTDPTKNDKLLQPYTTTDGKQFLGSGLWMQPQLAAKDLPKTRFSVKCKLKVEGRAKDAHVQWKPGDAWYPAERWFTGELKDCGKPVEQQ